MRLAHAIHLNHGDLLLPNRILRAALGGVIGRLAEATALQKRILNASRGPAVWALRAQTDQWVYACQMLQHTPNLHLREAMHAASRVRRGASLRPANGDAGRSRRHGAPPQRRSATAAAAAGRGPRPDRR